jgi:hypothetical protein
MSISKITSTAAALEPSVVAAIQERIKRHAPLEYSSGGGGGNKTFPPAIGYARNPLLYLHLDFIWPLMSTVW